MQIHFLKNKILFIALVLLLPSFSFAQTEGDVSLTLKPENPGPNSSVTATIQSFSVDLNKAKISWFVNGKTIATGTGKINFDFTTGQSNTKTNLEIQIETTNNVKIDKKIVLDGGEVNLLVSAADSFVPPFYRGRTLPARESQIKVTAVPNVKSGTKNLKQEDFVYKWTWNFKITQSEFNKSFLIFKQGILDNIENISVNIDSVKDGLKASNKISVTPMTPKIVFYEKDPVRGVNYNKALNQGLKLSKNETIIVASPYFFSSRNIKKSDLSFKWFMNDNEISDITTNELPVQIGQPGGTTKIGVEIESKSRLYQTLTASFVINY